MVIKCSEFFLQTGGSRARSFRLHCVHYGEHFFLGASQQEAHWSHAHPLANYWLRGRGLLSLWAAPICTEQNQGSLSKVEAGPWLPGGLRCLQSPCPHLHVHIPVRIGMSTVSVCTCRPLTLLYQCKHLCMSWTPTGGGRRPGSQVRHQPICRSHQEWALPSSSGGVSSMQQWGGVDSQTLISLTIAYQTRGGPACRWTYKGPSAGPRGPSTLQIKTAPPSVSPWSTAQSDHTLAWTLPWGGANWTLLLLHH